MDFHETTLFLLDYLADYDLLAPCHVLLVCRLSCCCCFAVFLPACLFFSEFGDVVATSESLEVEDAVAFDDSVAAIRRHLEDGTSNETIFEVGTAVVTTCRVSDQRTQYVFETVRKDCFCHLILSISESRYSTSENMPDLTRDATALLPPPLSNTTLYTARSKSPEITTVRKEARLLLVFIDQRVKILVQVVNLPAGA